MEPLKEYGATKLSLDNCMVPHDRLLDTPSSRDGCSHELEVDLRIVGCEYIQSAGLLLRLPQVAMATAQVLFQRFYYSKSFVKYSVQPLAIASVFLAAKIEEQCRRLREVINVFHHLKQKRMGRTVTPMDYMGEEYFKTKATVIKYERFLLKELGFCVHVKHPHKLVVTYLQMLDLHHSLLVQRAWNNMNDSLRTNVFVRFPPETIACACIFLAARQLKVSLPLRPPWWKVFGAEQKHLQAISFELLALYSRPLKMLDTLEKEVSALREKQAQKEAILKKIASAASSPEMPSSALTDHTSRAEDNKVHSKNPLVLTTLQASKPSSANPSPLIQSYKEPIKNGRKSPHEISRKRSRSPHNKHKSDRSRSRSPRNKHKSDRSKSRSPPSKLISGPLRLSSSESDTERPGSTSPSLNGIPERYRRDLEPEGHSRRSKHKHRSDKHSEHHSKRSKSSKYKSHDNEKRREYYEEYDKEREVQSKSYRKRGKDYERDYYSSSKIRKTELVRYR